jgi:KUP system potassium uptake protein
LLVEGNIRVSWIYVKICLLLNYIGQGSYLLAHRTGVKATAIVKEQLHINSFYDLMPNWFVIIGVIIATSAAIIASQAIIAGSFTLIGEALRLNLWPKMRVKYPSEAKGPVISAYHETF